jgi:putative transposase
VKSDNSLMPLSFTRTLRLKVRREAYAWLNAAAIEVNEVYNYCNETSYNAARRTDIKRKWLTGFDLCNLTVGASQYFDKIGADTIQSICVQYAQKRAAARRVKLRWRASRGTRRAAGLTWPSSGQQSGQSQQAHGRKRTTPHGVISQSLEVHQ